MTEAWVDTLREKVLSFIERVAAGYQFTEKRGRDDSTFLEELVRNYRRRQTQSANPEDAKSIAKLTQALKEAEEQNEHLRHELEELHQSQHQQANNFGANSMVMKVHDKWINFSWDTIVLAKKILQFSESLIKTKADKLAVEDYRKNLDSFESFLIMSKEDIQSLKQKHNDTFDHEQRPSSSKLSQLDMKKLKEGLLSEKNETVCSAILQALRFRIIKTRNGMARRSFIIQLVSNDFLNSNFIGPLLERKGYKVRAIHPGPRIDCQDDRRARLGVRRQELHHPEREAHLQHHPAHEV